MGESQSCRFASHPLFPPRRIAAGGRPRDVITCRLPRRPDHVGSQLATPGLGLCFLQNILIADIHLNPVAQPGPRSGRPRKTPRPALPHPGGRPGPDVLWDHVPTPFLEGKRRRGGAFVRMSVVSLGEEPSCQSSGGSSLEGLDIAVQSTEDLCSGCYSSGPPSILPTNYSDVFPFSVPLFLAYGQKLPHSALVAP